MNNVTADIIFSDENSSGLIKACPGEFETCEFDGIKFSDVPLRTSTFLDCTFRNCNLVGADVLGSSFRDARFIGCNLMGLNWSTLKRFENCGFNECKLDLSSFQGLNLKRLNCIDCSLKEVDFAETQLSDSNFSGSLLSGAIFTRSDLSKANLRTAKGYFIDPTYTKIKGTKFSLPEAISLLTALGVDIEY